MFGNRKYTWVIVRWRCNKTMKRTLEWTITISVVFQKPILDMFKFFCLFGGFWSPFFQSFGNITITGERLHNLTYALMATEQWGFYCVTGQSFIMIIYENPCHSNLLPSVWQWRGHYLFWKQKSAPTGYRIPISRRKMSVLQLSHGSGDM